MGTWTNLSPTCLCYKFCDVLIDSWAPLLWCALFSPDDIFVEKTDDGDNFAHAETTVRKARSRIRSIQKRIAGNEYAENLFAPLECIEQILLDIHVNKPLTFNLMEFQSDEGDWGPKCAMRYVNILLRYVKPFHAFIQGSSLAKLMKFLQKHTSTIFKGTLEKDKQSLRRKIRKTEWDFHSYAFEYLMGGPSFGDRSKGVMKYHSWIAQNKHIWGEQVVKKTSDDVSDETEDGTDIESMKENKPEKQDEERPTKQNGLVKRHKDGKLLSELSYKNGKLHGICKYYNDDGILERELQYKNGKRNGLCKYWEDGNIKSVSNYKDDRIHGIDKYYDYNTRELRETNLFKDGRIIKKLQKKTS